MSDHANQNGSSYNDHKPVITGAVQHAGGVRDELLICVDGGGILVVRVEAGACAAADRLRRNAIYGEAHIISHSDNGLLIEHRAPSDSSAERLCCRHIR